MSTGPALILLVEDNPADQELTRFAVEDAGLTAELVVVEDGTDALDFLRRLPPFEDAGQPDLVLLDIRLPKLDGTEVLRQVRGDAALRAIPVVMLTADDDVRGALGDQAGVCDGYLVKPIDGRALREVIETLDGSGSTG